MFFEKRYILTAIEYLFWVTVFYTTTTWLGDVRYVAFAAAFIPLLGIFLKIFDSSYSWKINGLIAAALTLIGIPILISETFEANRKATSYVNAAINQLVESSPKAHDATLRVLIACQMSIYTNTSRTAISLWEGLYIPPEVSVIKIMLPDQESPTADCEQAVIELQKFPHAYAQFIASLNR